MFLLLKPWFAQLCTDETRFEPQGFDHTRLSFIKFSSGSLNLNWKVNFWTKNVYGFQSEILYTLMLTSLLCPHPGRLLGLFGNNKMSWRNPAEDLVADRDAVQTEMWQKRPKIQEMWSISPLHQVGPLSPLSCQSWWKLSYSFRSELFCDGNVNCAVGTQLPAGLSHQLSL